ncbi:MAG: glycosyltransferase [Phycisphaerae bacterium]|nr:glycosyltransferase [Phycisphaerae bacterium]
MDSVNLLVVSNNPLRPSYRQRIGDFLPFLQDNGISTEVHQLPKKKFRRWSLFKSARNYDVVLLHKKCLNFFDAKILRRYSKKIIYDFDDAIMYSPQKPESDNTSHFRLFERTVRLADCVIAGNDYLAEHARRFCANVHVLPTGLNVSVYEKPAKKVSRKIRLVWIGSQSTLRYLQDISPVLEKTAKEDIRVTLRVISDNFPLLNYMKLEKHAWSLKTQAADLLACNIGLAPLPDNRFTRGKCGFKILQYFAAGLPVIASPVGVNRDLIEKSGAGMLASTSEQWQEAIEKLVEHPQLREEMGQKARQFVKQYDTRVLAEKLCGIIQPKSSKVMMSMT